MNTLQVSYKEFQENNSKELQEFISKNCFWAFSREQLAKKLSELNITREEFESNYRNFIGGGFIRRDKVTEYNTIAKRASKNMRNMIFNDLEFAKDAFMYQMNNYECFISNDYEEVKEALGLTDKDINSNPMLLEAWNSAKEEYYNKCIRMC